MKHERMEAVEKAAAMIRDTGIYYDEFTALAADWEELVRRIEAKLAEGGYKFDEHEEDYSDGPAEIALKARLYWWRWGN